MSILKGIIYGSLGRLFYDSQMKKNNLKLLEKEEYIIPADDFITQNFYIKKRSNLEIYGKLIDGQEIKISVIKQGDYEWAVETGKGFDPKKEFIIDSNSVSQIEFELPAGDYILHLAPVHSSGKPSRFAVNADIHVQSTFNKLFNGPGDRRSSLNLTRWTWASIFVWIYGVSTVLGVLFIISSPQVFFVMLFWHAIYSITQAFLLHKDAKVTRQKSEFPKNKRKYVKLSLVPLLNLFIWKKYMDERKKAVKI